MQLFFKVSTSAGPGPSYLPTGLSSTLLRMWSGPFLSMWTHHHPSLLSLILSTILLLSCPLWYSRSSFGPPGRRQLIASHPHFLHVHDIFFSFLLGIQHAGSYDLLIYPALQHLWHPLVSQHARHLSEFRPSRMYSGTQSDVVITRYFDLARFPGIWTSLLLPGLIVIQLSVTTTLRLICTLPIVLKPCFIINRIQKTHTALLSRIVE